MRVLHRRKLSQQTSIIWVNFIRPEKAQELVQGGLMLLGVSCTAAPLLLCRRWGHAAGGVFDLM
jgi:hypothetical protein